MKTCTERLVEKDFSEFYSYRARCKQCYRDRTNDPCAYCGLRGEVMHNDHMTPLLRGGTGHWWNLTRACADCNQHKKSKTADEFIELLAKEGVNR